MPLRLSTLPLFAFVRHSSTLYPLSSALKSRTLPVLHDYLNPTSSYLLRTTLSSYLPFLDSNPPPSVPLRLVPPYQPPGHHLVYFPTPLPPSSLLPDGTDTLHSPGEPFTHRLWAGGSLHLPRHGGPRLDNNRAAIVEAIRDVRVTGQAGSENEKVFVSIERRLALVEDADAEDASIRASVWRDDEQDPGRAVLIERRELCFMRPPLVDYNHETVVSRRRRPLRPSPQPDFCHELTPDAVLLFRFSALSYNAHAIHLDPLYTRTVYGQPALLVHGPLLLVLMLTCLDHELAGKSGRLIRQISYRCLAPVYVGERVRVCGRKMERATAAAATAAAEEKEASDDQMWEVWVEKDVPSSVPGKEGEVEAALVVRGTVRTEDGGNDHRESPDRDCPHLDLRS